MNAETGKAAQTVKDLIAGLAGTYEHREPPDVDQRIAAWWWGQQDETLHYAVGIADMIAREPVSASLYLAYAAEDTTQFRNIKAWGYGVAAEFASGRAGGPRNRVRVEGYRATWGRQAARDGLARSLWPEMVDCIPGRDSRCAKFGVGHTAFMRVRDEVENRAKQARQDYRDDLENLLAERWTRDMRERYEAAIDNRAAKWGRNGKIGG